MSAYPTSFPATHEAWTTMEVPTDRPGHTKTITRVNMGLAKTWVKIPYFKLGLDTESCDPTADDILSQEQLLGAEKVAQMLWLYKEEFMKTTHELLIQVDAHAKSIKSDFAHKETIPMSVRKAKVAEFQFCVKKVLCIGQIHLAKSQRLWKMTSLEENSNRHPLYKVSLQTHIKMYEHVEKSYRFALAGNRVKATKFAEKLQGDMDDIWTNMMELTDEGLDVHFTKNDENDKVQKTHGDWAQKEILDHIVEMRKNCLEVIEHLC